MYVSGAGIIAKLFSYSVHVRLRQSLVLCLHPCVPDADVLELISHCRAMLHSFFFRLMSDFATLLKIEV